MKRDAKLWVFVALLVVGGWLSSRVAVQHAKRIEALETLVSDMNIVHRLQVLETVAYRLPTNAIVIADGSVLDEGTPELRHFRNPAEYIAFIRTNALRK